MLREANTPKRILMPETLSPSYLVGVSKAEGVGKKVKENNGEG